MKSERFRSIAPAVVLMAEVAVLVSCATIINGTSQDMTVNSEPSQAKVVITEGPGGRTVFEGQTPMLCRLSRNSAYVVIITLPGYNEQKIYVAKELSMVFLGNLIIGGVPGMLVDVITGAMWDLKPAVVSVSLSRATGARGETEWHATMQTPDGRGGVKAIVVPLVKS